MKSSVVPAVFFHVEEFTLPCRALFAGILLACTTVTAGAHQPYESSAQARLEGEEIELTVTASLEIAKLLAEKTAASGGPHGRLLEACAGLYEVTGNGEPLRPERVFYNEREGEAVFSAIYQAARPGELKFRAVYLDKLPAGYGASLKVVEDAGKILGFQQRLRKGDADNFVSVRIKPAAGHSAESAPVPASPDRPRFDSKPWRPNLPLTSLAVVMILACTASLVARSKSKEKIHV